MVKDPSEFQGVGGEPGTGGKEGVPLQQGQPPEPPAVPSEQPTAPQTVAKVNLDDLEEFRRWKAETDRRAYGLQIAQEEARQQAEQARREADEWRTKAETADMPEEDRYKYLYQKSQERITRLEQQQAEYTQLIQWQYHIADRLGVPATELNPMEGVQGMIERAGTYIDRGRTSQQGIPPMPSMPTRTQPSQAPTQATPTQQESPRAPSAPTSSAPASEFEEYLSTPTWAERRKKIPKGKKEFEAWMEELGEK